MEDSRKNNFIMKKVTQFFVLSLLVLLMSCNSDPNTYYDIETSNGTIKIKLYATTPGHQANFQKLVDEKFYDGLLFHRVMPNFMVQGGDPASRDAAPGARLGNGGPGWTLPAEIGAPHFRGAISAARLPDGANPKMESSGSQFFIVTGNKENASSMQMWSQRNKVTYSPEQLKIYAEEGGRPDLDGKYSVFGEVVEGMDIVDALSIVATDRANRPVEDFKIISVKRTK